MTDAGLATLTVGAPATVWVHTHVREDVIRLFGFSRPDERLLFGLLLSVSGIGPKLAMGILNHVDALTLVHAVEKDDGEALEAVPGIGARQSKKIILELKPKLPRLVALGATAPAPATPARAAGAAAKAGLSRQTVADLRSALENLGYKDKEYGSVLRRLEQRGSELPFTELMRQALAELAVAPSSPKIEEDLF
jgi:Holliday junction DNA helicase RuvA